MKKTDLVLKREKLEKEASVRLDDFQKFLDEEFSDLHEYPPNDTEFNERVNRLFMKALRLWSATDRLHYFYDGKPL